jgi:hypothetical protein
MLPFKLIYSSGYYLPIGAHVFPAEKYRRVRAQLLADGVAEANDFLKPEPATDEDILLVHTPEYVDKLATGTLSTREEMELEIPYSRELVDAFWLAAGGSILAARQALADSVSINIGGGFHHAFPDHGEGFCMIHDVAVAIRLRRASRQRNGGNFWREARPRPAVAFRERISCGYAWNSPPQRQCRRRFHHLPASAQQLSGVQAAIVHRRGFA